MSNQENISGEEYQENLNKTINEYDKVLFENANLIQRFSQFVGTCQDILEISQSGQDKKKPPKPVYGVEIVQSYYSLNDIPKLNLNFQAPPNYYDPPTTFA